MFSWHLNRPIRLTLSWDGKCNSSSPLCLLICRYCFRELKETVWVNKSSEWQLFLSNRRCSSVCIFSIHVEIQPKLWTQIAIAFQSHHCRHITSMIFASLLLTECDFGMVSQTMMNSSCLRMRWQGWFILKHVGGGPLCPLGRSALAKNQVTVSQRG